MDSKVYRKHNSFVGIRHKHTLDDVLPRIQRLAESLPTLSVAPKIKTVITKACREIIGIDRAPDGQEPFKLHTNVIEEIERLGDTELPRYLHYRYRYEVYPDRHILDEFPPLLQIEPSSICNYRCVFCYQTDTDFTRKANGHMGLMSLDLFKRIIDEAAGRCDAITLASRGEPLICPQIKEMLAYARGKFLAMKINTNAWYLDEDKCHAILQAEPNTLVFSADAASEPQYSQFRVGGSLDRVLKNITMFRDIRARQYPDSQTITRVSGVKVPGTPELDEMDRFWGELVDQVAFVTYNPWENTYVQPPNDITTPCSDLWRRSFVWWDGKVNPCDVDYKSTLAVGNVKERSISNIWQSDTYNQLRQKHLTKKRSLCSPCNRCTVV